MSMKDEYEPDGPNPPKSVFYEAGKALFDANDYSLREEKGTAARTKEVLEHLEQIRERWRQMDEKEERSPHYDQGKLPTWDAITGLGLNFLEGNVVKYVSRHRHKGTGKEDLIKALDYVVKLIVTEHPTTSKEHLERVVERHFE